jgi:hypothetical protein
MQVTANRRESGLAGLVREILGAVDKAQRGKPTSLGAIERDLNSIAQRNYGKQLKGYFSQREMREIVAAITLTFPTLNRKLFDTTELQGFAEIASKLGTRLRATSFVESSGRALRGFYVQGGGVLKRPLIYVNTAHHPIAIAASFWHEVGHHLTAQLFEGHQEPVDLSFGTDYADHLEDPLELVADMMVALAAYPKAATRRLYAASVRSGVGPDARESISKAIKHLRLGSEFEFDKWPSAVEKLHYLAGMIHYARLRWALLAEYDI